MANKKTTKKGAQAAKAVAPSKADAKKAKQPAKGKVAKAAAPAKNTAKNAKAAKGSKGKSAKNANPGFIERAKKYLGSVRTEMRRVTWPSKQELINYSVAVCASLIVVGIAIAVFDMVISEGLALFAGLRG